MVHLAHAARHHVLIVPLHIQNVALTLQERVPSLIEVVAYALIRYCRLVLLLSTPLQIFG